MFVETRLMNNLGISFSDATTLVSKAHNTLGIRRANDQVTRMQVYREARRIHSRLLERRQRELSLAPARAGRRWTRATVTPL
jgi:hypothetical protein